MRRLFIALVALALLAALGAAPAAGDPGTGELQASFNAGLSGGSAIDFHSNVADGVASPQVNPAGRLEPFGAPEAVCDELQVGTWVFWVAPTRAGLATVTNSFSLDGVPLDTERTPDKRFAQGAIQGWWWFAEGVPVLGSLDPGSYTITFSFDDGAGFTGTINTPVTSSASNC